MEQPPKNTDPRLAEYLTRQLEQLTLRDVSILQVRNVLPQRPVVGKLYYFLVTAGPPITAEGLWLYKTTGYTFIG